MEFFIRITCFSKLGLMVLVLISGLAISQALKCYTCLPDPKAGLDCRAIATQTPVNCSADSKHCVAVVLGNAQGEITVYRGCGNYVSGFNLGTNECSILDTWTEDLPAAYYKCKTDGCNNIEPITVEITEIVNHPVSTVTANSSRT